MFRFILLPVFLSVGSLAAGQDASTAQTCLASIQNLAVITPSSSTYSAAKQPFNLRLSPSPAIIVSPTSVPQVQSIVACAANASLSVSAKSGGHSYAAYGLSGDVVIDLHQFKGLKLDPSGKVAVQTGNSLGDVATGIYNQGKRALPHGSCPYVGTGGHTLYGGFGYFSRIGGLLLDRVVSAEVVLANGTLVTASSTSHPDLFWAIRGGGPSFGIVTAWTYDTLPAPTTVINYQITFGKLSVNDVISAYIAWQSFATTVPNELALAAVLGTSNGGVSLSLSGDYYGTKTQFNKLMAPLLAKLPKSASLSAKTLDWIGGLEADAGNNNSLNTSKPDTHDTFFVKSLVTTGPSSNASISSWIKYIASAGVSSDTAWFAQVDLYGGAITSVPVDSTAFSHRNAFMVFQLYASSSNSLPPYPTDGIAFITGMLTALEPHPQGAYPNYIDPTLSSPEWQAQYFGANVGRLQRVKKDVDPINVFKFTEGF